MGFLALQAKVGFGSRKIGKEESLRLCWDKNAFVIGETGSTLFNIVAVSASTKG